QTLRRCRLSPGSRSGPRFARPRRVPRRAPEAPEGGGAFLSVQGEASAGKGGRVAERPGHREVSFEFSLPAATNRTFPERENPAGPPRSVTRPNTRHARLDRCDRSWRASGGGAAPVRARREESSGLRTSGPDLG